MFELKHPSNRFRHDLALVVQAAPLESLPCCQTRDTIVADAIRIGIWEFGEGGTINVWLDPEGEHKVTLESDPCE